MEVLFANNLSRCLASLSLINCPLYSTMNSSFAKDLVALIPRPFPL